METQDNQTLHQPEILTPKQELLKSLSFNTGCGIAVNPIDLIHTELKNVIFTADTIRRFARVREGLIEQKAYQQMGLRDGELNKDIAAQASLWGQIILIDTILESIQLSD